MLSKENAVDRIHIAYTLKSHQNHSIDTSVFTFKMENHLFRTQSNTVAISAQITIDIAISFHFDKLHGRPTNCCHSASYGAHTNGIPSSFIQSATRRTIFHKA